MVAAGSTGRDGPEGYMPGKVRSPASMMARKQLARKRLQLISLRKKLVRALLGRKCGQKKRRSLSVLVKMLKDMLATCPVATVMGSGYCEMRKTCYKRRGCWARVRAAREHCASLPKSIRRHCFEPAAEIAKVCRTATVACNNIGFKTEGEGCSGVCSTRYEIAEIRAVKCGKKANLDKLRRAIRRKLRRIEELKGIISGRPSNKPRRR